MSDYWFKIGDFAPMGGGGGRLTQNFRQKWSAATNHSSSQKLRLNDLSQGIKIWTATKHDGRAAVLFAVAVLLVKLGYTIDADKFLNMIRVTGKAIPETFKRRIRLDIRKYVFGNRVTGKWNNSPHCCINCTTLNNFKFHVHKALKPETEL